MQKLLLKLFLVGALFLCTVMYVDAADPAAHRVPPPLPDNLSLQVALDYALNNSFSILQARERIEEQYGLRLEVGSGVLPNLSLNSSYSEQDEGLAGDFSTEDNWGVSLQVRQALYSGGSLRASIRAQGAIEKAALYDLQVNVETTIQDVKTRYYDVLLARDTIEVEEQNIELLQEQLENTESRFEAGTVSNFDVLQAKVSLANAKPALIRANNGFRVAVAELKKTVGYMKEHDYVTKSPNFEGELEVIDERDYELVDSMMQALQRRPELAKQKLIITAREENIDVARAGYYPSVDLIGSYDFRRSYEASDDRFDDPEDGWYVGVESSWNIWDGRATDGRVVQARSLMRQDVLNFDETRLAIEVEVRRAISELQGAAELLEAARQVTGQAEESLRLANERYNVGSSTFLDTLQARVALTDARNNELQANYSYLVSIVNVQRSIGETKYNFVK